MPKTYGGRWKTLGSVGEGGQAHLFSVEDTQGEHEGRFVLKRLKNVKRMDLFKREIDALRAMNHPNILRVIDFDLASDQPYYVAEYCTGGSLDKMAAGFRADIGKTASVLVPIIQALRAAHEKGVIHRDVKPPNLLFRGDGTPVLGDFGICHMEGDERVTLSDEAMGSKDYIAPEMESGRHGPVTGAVDVYALGKVMYWMISGGRIFAREDHRAGNLYLPSALGDQRWEHVHWLLDHTVVEDRNQRLDLVKLRDWVEGVTELVERDSTPLRPSMGLRCRFCGIGKYVRYAAQGRGGPRSAGWFTSAIGNYAGCNIGVLRCGHCGHVEWFDFTGIQDEKWWDR